MAKHSLASRGWARATSRFSAGAFAWLVTTGTILAYEAGDYVVTLRQTGFKVGAAIIDELPAGCVVRVDSADGNWVWVLYRGTSVLIEQRDVVSVEEVTASTVAALRGTAVHLPMISQDLFPESRDAGSLEFLPEIGISEPRSTGRAPLITDADIRDFMPVGQDPTKGSPMMVTLPTPDVLGLESFLERLTWQPNYRDLPRMADVPSSINESIDRRGEPAQQVRVDPLVVGGKILWSNRRDVQQILRVSARAIELDPDCAHAYYDRGLAMECAGFDGLALAAYSEAIRLNPKFVCAYYSRSLLWNKWAFCSQASHDIYEALCLDWRIKATGPFWLHTLSFGLAAKSSDSGLSCLVEAKDASLAMPTITHIALRQQ